MSASISRSLLSATALATTIEEPTTLVGEAVARLIDAISPSATAACDYGDLLTRLTASGVPIPLRVLMSAAGYNFGDRGYARDC